MTGFSRRVNEKSACIPEAKEMKMPAQAEKPQNTFDRGPSPTSQHYTEILQHGNIDKSNVAKLKLATRRLANRHRQRLFRERKRWKNVAEKSTNIKSERFTKIDELLKAKHLTNFRYQHAMLDLRWTESAMEALNTEANVNQLDESRAEEIHRTGLDCAREVVEKVLARMSHDVHRLSSERESSDIYNGGRSAENALEEIDRCISTSPFAENRPDRDGRCDRSVG